MPPHKAKHRANHPQQAPQPPPPLPSDYETDAPPPPVDLPLPPQRSNEELNLSVLQRKYPELVSILHVAPYAVLYSFNIDSNQWEKLGIEGTLFLCQLTPSSIGSDRFSVVILNRRGLNNFDMEIASTDEIEITDEYVILQGDQVYGIWIFSEPPPSSTANCRVETAEKIKECAQRAALTREAKMRERENGVKEATEQAETASSVPMGRQLSLRELFGQQREQDAAWSLHNHQTQPQQTAPAQHQHAHSDYMPTPSPQPAHNDVLGQLFLKAKQGYNGVGS